MRANLNHVMSHATSKSQIEDLIVYNTRKVFTGHWDEEKQGFESVEPGDTFRVCHVICWPYENDGRGVVGVEYYNGEVEERWADAFEVRR